MAADLNTNITVQGTPEELFKILKVLKSYNNGNNKVYIDMVKVSGSNKTFRIDQKTNDDTLKNIATFYGRPDVTKDSPEMLVEFGGPWGKFGDPVESGIYEALADVADNAFFSGTTTGFVVGADVTTTAIYQAGKLEMRDCYIPNEAYTETYIDKFKEKIPFKKFLNVFSLRNVSDEFLYDDFISSFIVPDEKLENLPFDEFVEFWEEEANDIQSPADYEELLERYRKLPIPLFEEVVNQLEKDCTDTIIYDPKNKKNV